MPLQRPKLPVHACFSSWQVCERRESEVAHPYQPGPRSLSKMIGPSDVLARVDWSEMVRVNRCDAICWRMLPLGVAGRRKSYRDNRSPALCSRDSHARGWAGRMPCCQGVGVVRACCQGDGQVSKPLLRRRLSESVGRSMSCGGMPNSWGPIGWRETTEVVRDLALRSVERDCPGSRTSLIGCVRSIFIFHGNAIDPVQQRVGFPEGNAAP